MTPERRQHPVARVLFWFLAIFSDSWHGLSLTRLLVLYCGTLVGHEVFVHERALSWVDFSLLVMSFAAAFGKKAFLAYLSRTQTTVQGQQMDVTAKVEEVISARRDAANGWEPTP